MSTKGLIAYTFPRNGLSNAEYRGIIGVAFSGAARGLYLVNRGVVTYRELPDNSIKSVDWRDDGAMSLELADSTEFFKGGEYVNFTRRGSPIIALSSIHDISAVQRGDELLWSRDTQYYILTEKGRRDFTRRLREQKS